MRQARALSTLVVVAFMALAWASTAGADRPVKEPAPWQDVHGITGICPFPISWTAPAANNGFSIFHLQKDGSAWLWGGGNTVSRITNDVTGAYVDINSTGPGKVTVADDGTATLEGSGHWLVGDFATDSPPSTLLLYSGHIVIDVSPDGQLTLVSYVGAPPQDVCAMIA